MLVSDAISYGKAVLSNSSTIAKEDLFSEVEILLSHVLKKPRIFFISHPEYKLSKEQEKKYISLCKKRADGHPSAYLIGYKEFYGLKFIVNENVLIPRSETEILVEQAIEYCKNTDGKKSLSLCDVGTGSGNIAISVAKNTRKNIKIVAVDISKKAISVAKENAKKHSVTGRIKFLQSNLMVEIFTFNFDGIIANLPYIGFEEDHLVNKEVKDFEPREALFPGQTGVELYERLFMQLLILKKMHAAKKRRLICEIGFLQKLQIKKLIQKYFGRVPVLWKNDLAGLPRAFSLYF